MTSLSDISPSSLAIKALQLWQAGHTATEVAQELNSSLEKKGLPADQIQKIVNETTPIIEGLRTSIKQKEDPSTDTPRQPMPMLSSQRPRFPDPEPFDGTRLSYPVFKQKAKAKIDMDGAIYGSECGQVNYLFSRLSGTAAKTVLPWLNSQSHPTLLSFWAFMDLRFSDPQAKAKALDKLQSMTQKQNEDIRDYLARFEQELLESEVVIDNAIKISTFTRGLKPQVQRDIAVVNNNTDFETYCQEAIRIQDAHKRISFLSKTPFIPLSQPRAHPDPDTMDWQPTRVNLAMPEPTENAKRHAKWVPKDEITKRRQNRLCLRCGASGHMVRTCPYLPPRRPLSGDSVYVATTIVEPVLEEEPVSGKE